MSIATVSDFEVAPARPLVTPLMLAAGCVALADWLFYGWDIGISLALFLGVLGIAGVAGNRARAPRNVQIVMAAIFLAGLLALIEAVNALSVTVAALATALFVIVITAPEASSWPSRLLAAFIWMLLVATGLLLILIQIVRRKSLSWLVAANAVSLALVLYGCCFINAPRLVAAYNVAHSREALGTGPWLDKEYLSSLGPQVLPVLEPRLPQILSLQSTVSQLRSSPNICENRRRRSENWRAMDFRTWRLQRYLANNPDMATKSPDSSKG